MSKVYNNKATSITQNDRFIRPVDMNIELDCYKYTGVGGYTSVVGATVDSAGNVIVDTTKQAPKEFDYNNQSE